MEISLTCTCGKKSKSAAIFGMTLLSFAKMFERFCAEAQVSSTLLELAIQKYRRNVISVFENV